MNTLSNLEVMRFNNLAENSKTSMKNLFTKYCRVIALIIACIAMGWNVWATEAVVFDGSIDTWSNTDNQTLSAGKVSILIGDQGGQQSANTYTGDLTGLYKAGKFNGYSGSRYVKVTVPSGTTATVTAYVSAGSTGRYIDFLSTPASPKSGYNVNKTREVGTVSFTSDGAAEKVMYLCGSNSWFLLKLVVDYTDQSCTKITPSLSYTSTTLTVGGVASATPAVTGNTGGGIVTYEVTSATPEGCVTVNTSTGVVTPVATGTATVTATVAASGDYCSGTATANFIIEATSCSDATPTISAAGATTFCDGESVVLTAEGYTAGATLQWYKDGTAISGATSSTYTADASGSYTVKANQNCEKTSAATTVTVNALPSAPTITDNGNNTFSISGTGTIYYTTDGTVPTTASPVYSSIETITSNVTVKAIAVNNGCESTVAASNIAYSTCSTEQLVWKSGTTFPSGGVASTVSKASEHSSVVTMTLEGTSAEGSSLNSGKTAGSTITFTAVNPAKQISNFAFYGKIEDASLEYSVDGGTTWITLTSTSTDGDANYSFEANSPSVILKSTGTAGFWLRNMEIEICDGNCTNPGTASLTAASSALALTGSSVSTTLTASGGSNTSTPVYTITPVSGASISGTTFTATVAGTYKVTASYAADGTYCATSASTTITVTAPEIYVSYDGTEVTSGSTVDLGSIELTAADGTTTSELTKAFTIRNDGNSSLTLTTIMVGNTSGNAFGGNCNDACGTLNASEIMPMDVTIAAGLAAGVYTGTVTIASNDPDENLFSFNITYTVTNPDMGTPTVTITTDCNNINWTEVTGAAGYNVKICSGTAMTTHTFSSLANIEAAGNVAGANAGFYGSNNVLVLGRAADCIDKSSGGVGASNVIYACGATAGYIVFQLTDPLAVTVKNYEDNEARKVDVSYSTEVDGTYTSLGSVTTKTGSTFNINKLGTVYLKIALNSASSNWGKVSSLSYTAPSGCTTIDAGTALTLDATANMTAGNTYSVAVQAKGGEWSEIKTLTATPAAIADLTATPGSTTAGLSWTAVAGAAKYNVYSDAECLNLVATVTADSYTLTGLTEQTAYTYYVKAANAAGCESDAASVGFTTSQNFNVTLTSLTRLCSEVALSGATYSFDEAAAAASTTISTSAGSHTLEAVAPDGYIFDHWEVGGTEYTGNPLSLNVSADVEVKAYYAASAGCKTYVVFRMGGNNKLYEVSEDASTITASSDFSVTTSNATYKYAFAGTSYTAAELSNSANFSSTSTSKNSQFKLSGTGSITVENPNGLFIKSVTFAGQCSSSDGTTLSIGSDSRDIKGKEFMTQTWNLNSTEGFTFYNGAKETHAVLLIEACSSASSAASIEATFSPATATTGVDAKSDVVVTLSPSLYYNNAGTLTEIIGSDGISADETAKILDAISLTKNSGVDASSDFGTGVVAYDATNDVITVTYTPVDNMDYSTEYKVTVDDTKIVNSACEGILNNWASFTTESTPVPFLKVMYGSNTVADNTGSYSIGALKDTDSSATKTFTLKNTGKADLTICNISSSDAQFTVSPATATIAPGGEATLTVTYTPDGIGTHGSVITIESDDHTDGTDHSCDAPSLFEINVTGSKAGFVLPYTYESGCVSPIASENELRQDYTSIDDIPSQITLDGGTWTEDDNYYPQFNIYSSLGSCVPNGNSAIIVGDGTGDAKILKIDTKGKAIGNITVGWTGSGYRKIKILNSNDIINGVAYAESDGWETANECHTITATINDCATKGGTGTDVAYIAISGLEAGARSVIYYLNITPCDPEQKSSMCELTNVESPNQATGVTMQKIGNDIFLEMADCTGGKPASTFIANVLAVSPGARVSPGVNEEVTLDANGYAVYTVTAADEVTKKVYHVYPECQVDLDPDKCYEETIQISWNMGTEDKEIFVNEITGSTASSCSNTLQETDAGVSYTIHYLTKEDVPAEGYKINGPTQVCVGSVSEYTLANAPESNNPVYSWSIAKVEGGFTIVDGKEDPTGSNYTYDGAVLRLKAPETLGTSGNVEVSITIDLDFTDAKCAQLKGTSTLAITATDQPASPVNKITNGCADANGRLLLSAAQGTSNVNGSDVTIDATHYEWSFTPSGLNVVLSQDNEITLNLGKTAPAIEATVVASNACGSSAPYTQPLVYGSAQTTWVGTTSSDWNTASNWTKQVPMECTDVTIPKVGESVENPAGGFLTVTNYPEITTDAAADNRAVCDEITFKTGAGVRGIEKLNYRRAYVKQTFSRNKWYTLTSPLKEMYAADYYFNGNPLTYVKKFDVGPNYTQKWSNTYTNLKLDLSSGIGFGYMVSIYDRSLATTPDNASTSTTAQIIDLPRMSKDSSLLTTFYMISPMTGNLLLNFPKTVTKTEDAYRFAMETSSSDGTIHNAMPASHTVSLATTGDFTLIGNPIMSYLDLNSFVSNNPVKSTVYFWNGSSTEGLIVTKESTLGASEGATGNLAPMQAFLVQNDGGSSVTFDFARDYKTTVSSTDGLRSVKASDGGTLYVIGNDGQTTSYLSLWNTEGAVNGYLEGEDAVKIFGTEAKNEIYVMASGKKLDINQFSSVPYEVPLAVNTKNEKDTIDLTFNGAESFENVDVTLVNKITGEEINMKDENTYRFAFTKENAESALAIRFSQPEDAIMTNGNEVSGGNSGIQIFVRSGNVIRVMSSSDDPIVEVSVFDAAGKLMSKEKMIGDNVTVFDKVMNAGSRNVVVTAVTQSNVKSDKLQLK